MMEQIKFNGLESVRQLIKSGQRFTTIHCGRRPRYIKPGGTYNGREYVDVVTEYENGTRPAVNMPIEAAAAYLEQVPGLSFLPLNK